MMKTTENQTKVCSTDEQVREDLKSLTSGCSYGDEDYDEEGAVEGEIEPMTIGEGDGEVFMFYYTANKTLAKLRGEDDYSCKIGMTMAGHEKRRSSSGVTDGPGRRVVALSIKTDHPVELEKIIHSTLNLRGKQLSGPGREWFLTNEHEVLDIYKSIFLIDKDNCTKRLRV